MSTVTTSRTSPNFRPVACAGCELVNDCSCLGETRVLELLAPLVRRLLELLAQESCIIEDDFTDQIALLLDRNDQREREIEAMPVLGDAEDLKCDRVIVEDLVAPWGYEAAHQRTVEGVAALRKVSVDRVRGLLEAFLRDSRPEEAVPSVVVDEPARLFTCACAGDHGRLTGCSGAGLSGGRCAWCVANHQARPKVGREMPRRAGQSFLFDFVDAEVA